MQYPFILNPTIASEEATYLIYRKLEQAHALADAFAIFAINDGDLNVISRGIGAISDLMEDLNQLFEVVAKKIEALN